MTGPWERVPIRLCWLLAGLLTSTLVPGSNDTVPRSSAELFLFSSRKSFVPFTRNAVMHHMALRNEQIPGTGDVIPGKLTGLKAALITLIHRCVDVQLTPVTCQSQELFPGPRD